jgi:hypothetical protein
MGTKLQPAYYQQYCTLPPHRVAGLHRQTASTMGTKLQPAYYQQYCTLPLHSKPTAQSDQVKLALLLIDNATLVVSERVPHPKSHMITTGNTPGRSAIAVQYQKKHQVKHLLLGQRFETALTHTDHLQQQQPLTYLPAATALADDWATAGPEPDTALD